MSNARQYGAAKVPEWQKAQKGTGYVDRQDTAPKPKDEDPSPSAEKVIQFHNRAPIDTRAEDIHHTLGVTGTQASPGDHNHDGGDSVLLLEGFTIVGSKANPQTVLPSLIAGFVRLGMKDSTT